MDFKKVSEITAVAVPFLIVCSSIQLVTYYNHWNVPIFDYLSTAEILFLFIRPMLTIVLIAALYFVLNLLFFGTVTLYLTITNKKKSGEEKSVKPADTKAETKAGALVGYAVLLIGGIGIFLTFFQGIWYDYEIWPVVVLHVVIWLVTGVLIWHVRGKKDERLPAEWLVASTIPMLLSASFFYGRYQAHYTETSPTHLTVSLADGASFITDSNTLYLGKTSGFYFYYKTTEREALVIPAAQVKSVSIKQAE